MDFKFVGKLRRIVPLWLIRCRPGGLLLAGYGIYITLGTALLALPFMRVDGAGSWLDWLFTAASAVSTTGLATLSTGNDFSWPGQVVILLLIQAGGLGYMTFGSFVVMAVSKKLRPWRTKVASISLNLPKAVNPARLLKLIVLYTFGAELVGALWLFTAFRAAGVDNALWSAVFHSVSAFCTAGFSLYDDSFMAFRTNASVNLALIVLSYLGAIGFLVVHDLARSISAGKATLTLTSKIILCSTAVITLVGLIGLVIEEPLAPANTADGWMTAWFQIMTASTTVGFNTVDIGAMSSASAFLLLVCMLIGASPSGTGGGVKTTSLTAAWAVMVSVLKGLDQPMFMGRVIPEARRRLAVATILFYLLSLSLGIYCLAWVEKAALFDIIFECASAIGTVGLSRGITGSLSPAGKVIIIVLMVAGRIGPLLLAGVLFKIRGRPAEPGAATEDVVI